MTASAFGTASFCCARPLLVAPKAGKQRGNGHSTALYSRCLLLLTYCVYMHTCAIQGMQWHTQASGTGVHISQLSRLTALSLLCSRATRAQAATSYHLASMHKHHTLSASRAGSCNVSTMDMVSTTFIMWSLSTIAFPMTAATFAPTSSCGALLLASSHCCRLVQVCRFSSTAACADSELRRAALLRIHFC